jgi:hypothetical protein
MVGVSLAGLVPKSSAPSKALLPYFREYLLATGNHNTWRMFIDRPSYRSYGVVLAVEAQDGRKMRVGPVLPGLEPYDGSLRVLKVFHSYNRTRYQRYRQPYLESAKQQIQQKFGVTPRSIAIVYEVEQLEKLENIRRTGVLAKRRSWNVAR